MNSPSRSAQEPSARRARTSVALRARGILQHLASRSWSRGTSSRFTKSKADFPTASSGAMPRILREDGLTNRMIAASSTTTVRSEDHSTRARNCSSLAPEPVLRFPGDGGGARLPPASLDEPVDEDAHEDAGAGEDDELEPVPAARDGERSHRLHLQPDFLQRPHPGREEAGAETAQERGDRHGREQDVGLRLGGDAD